MNAQKNIVNSADGLVFQIRTDEDVLSQVAAIDAASLKLNKLALIHVTTSLAHPAHGQFDAIHLANQTALACLGAYSMSKGLMVLDTLMDIDRGDFPRGGLIDRRGNMNLSGRYLKSLLAFLEPKKSQHPLTIDEASTTQTNLLVRFQKNGRPYCLCLSQKFDGVGVRAISHELGKFRDCFDLRNGTFVDTDRAESSSAGLLVAL